MQVEALIFAGGVGQRMTGSNRPKQFLEIYGKPILVHTIEKFVYHPLVNHVTVCCLESWIDTLKNSLKQKLYNSKVSIVPGGETGQCTIYNGLKEINDRQKGLGSNTHEILVLIHDGVRPLIDEQTITACVNTAQESDSAITVVPAIETIAMVGEDSKVAAIYDRSTCVMARAPQCFYLSDIWNAHLKARADGLEFIDSLSLMMHYGFEATVVEGKPENIKVTTPTDFYACKAYVDMKDYDGLWQTP